MTKLLTPSEVLAAHDALTARFGGQPGLRDGIAFENIFCRATQLVDFATLNDLAGHYLSSLIKASPFQDNNKRLAWLCARLFLKLNGYTIATSDEAVLDLIVRITEGYGRTAAAIWFSGRMRRIG